VLEVCRFDLLGVDVQDTSSTTEALVPAAKIDGPDAILAQHGSAHDAGFDSDIEIGLVEDLDGMLGQDAGNGDELGVPGTVQSAVCLVHASADNFAVLHEDTADRCLVALQGKLSLP
jgi:hypothetical protein